MGRKIQPMRITIEKIIEVRRQRSVRQSWFIAFRQAV
jgi:hypothetical protein